MFKVTFLGGADEVGASCTLLEIAGRRLLIDCGIRMKPRAGQNLPFLDPIAEAGGLDAIILTHAHTDHTGGLPVIHQSYTHIPVYMTAATLSLTTILLMDSLKIMQMEAEREGEIPLYPLEAVEQLIGAARPVSFCLPLEIFGGDIRLTFTPAGHILGAATVLIETQDGVVLMGGDVSVTDQMTIPGMMHPPTLKPDLVVMESTYGGRRHADRSKEEGRLVERAKEVLERGGGILFPAFAVGRAQEVILICSKAMEEGAIPKAPIFVDGMVRSVCQAYRSYPDLLTPWLRKRQQTKGNPFYPDDGSVVPVFKPGLREKYANTRPAIYVASSGMLTGGPSPYYATKLAPNPKNCIAITGYQDEESPGRRVQDVARAGGGSLMLYEEEIELKCEVGTYGLSAHADTSQLVDSLQKIEPLQMALVHGDHGAREALEEALHKASLKRVHRPVIGASLEIEPQKRRRAKQVRTDTPTSKPHPDNSFASERKSIKDFTSECLHSLGQKLLERDGRGRNYTIPELLFAFHIQGELNEADLLRVAQLLQAKDSPFKRDKKRAFLYRLRTNADGELWTLTDEQTRKKARKDDINPILQRATELFPIESGMYKRKVRKAGPHLVLCFYFPKIQAPKMQEAIEQFKEETGWGIRIHDEVHQGALQEWIKENLPEGWKPKKNPALHLGEERISLQLASGHSPLDALEELQKRCLEETGFTLDIKPPELTTSHQTNNDKGEEILGGPEALAALSEPLELNQAYQLIREAFQEQPHQLLKCGQKGQHIELAFISPQVGHRYKELLLELQTRTGWLLKVKPHANQHKIKERAAELVPDAWELTKSPGFHEQEGFVSIQVKRAPSQTELAALSIQFELETGFQIRLK